VKVLEVGDEIGAQPCAVGLFGGAVDLRVPASGLTKRPGIVHLDDDGEERAKEESKDEGLSRITL
jgi:hypothetical protein